MYKFIFILLVYILPFLLFISALALSIIWYDWKLFIIILIYFMLVRLEDSVARYRTIKRPKL